MEDINNQNMIHVHTYFNQILSTRKIQPKIYHFTTFFVHFTNDRLIYKLHNVTVKGKFDELPIHL